MEVVPVVVTAHESDCRSVGIFVACGFFVEVPLPLDAAAEEDFDFVLDFEVADAEDFVADDFEMCVDRCSLAEFSLVY